MWRRKAINLHQWRVRYQKQFYKLGIDQPFNTSLILLAAALNRSKIWVLTHSDYQPTSQETINIRTLSDRVAEGHPLPYVLGEWPFFGRTFKVTPDVLIPRPETESLVEKALKYAGDFVQPKIIDVGTGSGAIAVSLAAELLGAKIIASDISRAALRIAEENAQRHGQLEIHFIQADLLEPIKAQFNVICANLPYIPTEKLQDLQVARWEPGEALDGGESGLEIISTLLHQSRERLAPKGVILLEIESSLGAAALSAAEAAFPKARARLIKDLAGRDRIIEILRA